jgi:hypothetical protein
MRVAPKKAPKHAQTSKITRFFHKKCIDCARSHTSPGSWCIGCRGGIIKKGTHTGKSYRYVLDHQTKYAKWIAFENGDAKYESFRRWIIDNPTRSKIVTECEGTIGTLDESDSGDDCSKTESLSDFDEIDVPAKSGTSCHGPSFSSNPRVNLRSDESGDTLMAIGKYQGESYMWIYLNDRSYCEWVRGLVGVSYNMNKFKKWLLTQH